MTFSEIAQQFVTGLRATTPLEGIAVVSGIVGVWLERKENIWLYPVGLVGIAISVYLCLDRHLLGEASVSLYYAVMSVWGWALWAKRKRNGEALLRITFSNGRDWAWSFLFFGVAFALLFAALFLLKQEFPGALPLPDAIVSAAAYTGMWLLARKKVESWYWWIFTNATSIPLYFVKDLTFFSVQFCVFTAMSVAGLIEWRRRALLQPPYNK